MSLVLIGSRALKLRVGNAFWREPLDFDFVATQSEADAWITSNYDAVGGKRVYTEKAGKKVIVEGSTMVEFDIVQPGSSDELLVKLVEEDRDTVETSFGLLPGIDVLFTTKDSHKFKKFNTNAGAATWWKTATDWHAMRRLGCKIREGYHDYHTLREQESYAAQRHPKLNVSKDAFFKDDNIDYQFYHDDLHRSVMLGSRPAYEEYLADGEAVKCSKEKFFSVSEDIRLAGVVEECLTLALERSLISKPGILTPDQAFRIGLSKVCSSITSGFFRLFAYQNIPTVIKLYEQTSKNYWVKFQNDVKLGLVKPFTGSKY